MDYKIEYLPLGNSVEGRPLLVKHFTALKKNLQKKSLLFLGGVHGDELEGVWLMQEFARRLRESYPFENISVTVLPVANPDGVAGCRRQNANGVDLNRNLPTQDWSPEVLSGTSSVVSRGGVVVAKSERYYPGKAPCSEPENKILVNLIRQVAPVAVLSTHSFTEYQININGGARIIGEVRKWAKSFQPACGYEITEDIGYPTPGSLGTYCGKELEIPTITLEIEQGMPQGEVLEIFIPLLEQSVSYWDVNDP